MLDKRPMCLDLILNLNLSLNLSPLFLKSFANDSNMEYQSVYLHQNSLNGQIADRRKCGF